MAGKAQMKLAMQRIMDVTCIEFVEYPTEVAAAAATRHAWSPVFMPRDGRVGFDGAPKTSAFPDSVGCKSHRLHLLSANE